MTTKIRKKKTKKKIKKTLNHTIFIERNQENLSRKEIFSIVRKNEDC